MYNGTPVPGTVSATHMYVRDCMEEGSNADDCKYKY